MNHSNSNSNSNATSRTAVAMHDNLELEYRYNAVETFLQLVGLDPDVVVEFIEPLRGNHLSLGGGGNGGFLKI